MSSRFMLSSPTLSAVECCSLRHKLIVRYLLLVHLAAWIHQRGFTTSKGAADPNESKILLHQSS